MKNKLNVINAVFYFVFVAVYLFVLQKFGMGESYSNIRYYIFAGIVIFSFFRLILKKGIYFFKDTKCTKETFLVMITAIIFYIFSVIKATQSGYDLNIRTYVQISLFLMPVIYVFCLTNVFKLKNIISLMKVTLILLIIAYFCESPHTLVDFFELQNWKNVNVFKSISFTESNVCAESFLQLFLFFLYFKNIKDPKIKTGNMKIYMWISFIFTILSFKRLGMLFAVIMLILDGIINIRGKISPKLIIVFPIFFTVITIFYTKFMQGELFPNVDIYSLTTGRNYILSLWEKNNYLSYGYGSSMLVIGRYLEMDLIQIYLELNVVALFAFCYSFFKLSKNNIYALLIMSYSFLNMVTASSLPYSLGWIILLLTVFCISSNKFEAKK